MKNQLILITLIFVALGASAQESFKISAVRTEKESGKASGEVILKDSVITAYIIGTESNTVVEATLSKKSPIFYLGQTWYKASESNIYISLYRHNNVLYKIGVYSKARNVAYWIEN